MKIRMKFITLTAAVALLLTAPATAQTTDACCDDHPAPAAQAVDEHDGHGHGTAAAGRAFCGEHQLYEDECGICQPQRAALLAAGESLKVRLASEQSATLGGLTTAAPGSQAAAGGISAYAEIDYDRNRLAHVTPLVGGVIRSVHVDVGARVTAGQVLLEIVSSEVASAKHTYLAAVLERDLREQDVQRERRLREQKIAAERDLQEAEAGFARAEAAAASAAQSLRNLGLDTAALQEIERRRDTTANYSLRAPFAGEVIQRHAVLGEAVAAGEPLLQVADLTHVWLDLSVPERALPLLRRGQPVVAYFDALPGLQVTGTLDWVGSGLDPRTRLLRARAVVPNPDRLLKAGLFGEASIAAGAAAAVMAVPVAAVQTVDGASFVFVQEQADLFQLRRVDLGLRLGDHVAVSAGLAETDAVVTAGSAALYTEFLKSKLGAGCAHD